MIDDTQRNSTTSLQGAHGGAIATSNGSVSMSHSIVSNSFVESIDVNYSTDGGCIAAETLFAGYSTISGCVTLPGADGGSAGGGASVELAVISLSTIYNNAAASGGGLETIAFNHGFTVAGRHWSMHSTRRALRSTPAPIR